MDAWEIPVIGLAGVGAGLINTVVGSGTLITFPALLAVGVPPLAANVSNTVGLFPGSFVGAHGYRHELEGQGRRALLLGAASILGGLSGAALLLVLPAAAFQAIVPTLIGIALALVAFGPRFTAWMAKHGRSVSSQVGWPLWLLTAGTG
ncbi:MAG: sulfite exporter TauE/SafE family protein, partial [Pseudonocardia sp.]|nr:sulfite exporter TauE/SafE family protein [Pseudonocardia sp.]